MQSPSVRLIFASLATASLAVLVVVCGCQRAPEKAAETTTTATADSTAAVPDPLPSWNDDAARQEIIAFVQRVTHAGGSEFVPPAERIAVFDNDGTLWAEQPVYSIQFALDRVKAIPAASGWKTMDPFRHLLAGDMKAFMAGGEKIWRWSPRHAGHDHG
jgi:hypothetical protein